MNMEEYFSMLHKLAERQKNRDGNTDSHSKSERG